MTKKTLKKFEQEQKTITKYIFNGLSTGEIAKKMNYSRSTISYRINMLFEKYYAANRLEFVITILAQVIESHKVKINENKRIIDNLASDLEVYRTLLKNIVSDYKKDNSLHHWINEANSLLGKN